MNEYTEFSRLTMTNIPKLILAVICSFASKLLSQENDTLAKATEEILRAYKELDAEKINEETPTADSTQLFDIATDSSLSPIDKAVYSVLCALVKPETSQCTPKVENIATYASCSQRSVQTSLNTLEKRGLIHRKHRFINHRQISSLYTVIRPQADGWPKHTPSHENNTCEEEMQGNASCTEDVSNPTELNPAYFEGRTDEGCNECTHVYTKDLQSNATQILQGEKILLESFKESLRGG